MHGPALLLDLRLVAFDRLLLLLQLMRPCRLVLRVLRADLADLLCQRLVFRGQALVLLVQAQAGGFDLLDFFPKQLQHLLSPADLALRLSGAYLDHGPMQLSQLGAVEIFDLSQLLRVRLLAR